MTKSINSNTGLFQWKFISAATLFLTSLSATSLKISLGKGYLLLLKTLNGWAKIWILLANKASNLLRYSWTFYS